MFLRSNHVLVGWCTHQTGILVAAESWFLCCCYGNHVTLYPYKIREYLRHFHGPNTCFGEQMGNVILVNDNKTGKSLKKVVRKQIGEILRTVKKNEVLPKRNISKHQQKICLPYFIWMFHHLFSFNPFGRYCVSDVV